MFIAPSTRLATLNQSDAQRLGAKEAARQAALLKPPGRPESHDATRTADIATRFRQQLEHAGWNAGQF
jgi:hypothetical protein